MPANTPEITNLLSRINVLEEKITYAEKACKTAIHEGKPDHELRRLKMRVTNLKKEMSLYHAPMQKLKPVAGFQSYLFNKIESLSQFHSSNYL